VIEVSKFAETDDEGGEVGEGATDETEQTAGSGRQIAESLLTVRESSGPIKPQREFLMSTTSLSEGQGLILLSQ